MSQACFFPWMEGGLAKSFGAAEAQKGAHRLRFQEVRPAEAGVRVGAELGCQQHRRGLTWRIPKKTRPMLEK